MTVAKKAPKKNAETPTSRKPSAHLATKAGKATTDKGAAMALAKADIKKVQGLLKSKTIKGVTRGMSLLESLGADVLPVS